MYKIGELARLCQVPIRTLRYYDQIGLLVPAHVDRATGYRSYAAEQFERLNRILVFKDLGLSLDEIRTLIAEGASLTDIQELVRRKHAQLEQHVEAERRRLARAAGRLALMAGNAQISDIAVRSVAPHWVASVRRTIRSHDECEGLFEELGRAVRGGGAQRQRGAIWHACERGTIDCEAFEILPARIAPKGRVTVRQLPAHRVAALIYRGDADYLPAYRAMRAWLGTSGLAIAGPKRELFLRGSESVTEIQFPIQGSEAHVAGPRVRSPQRPRSSR